MRVVFATAEMVPFAKTGGLGDVLGALPLEVSKQGHTVKVFLPFYEMVRGKNLSLRECVSMQTIPLNGDEHTGRVLSCELPGGVEVLFVDYPDFFDRDAIYGTEEGDYPDSDQRFTLFQKSCLETLKTLDFSPDIFHCHDWHTGLIPAFLKTTYKKDPFFSRTKTIFTIHNLAYQGSFPADSLEWTGIDKKEFKASRLKAGRNLNMMKAGLVYSDHITTVSERYSEEIRTKEYGCGLESVLKSRKEDLSGILNGLELDEWDPEQDKDLTISFKPNDWNIKLASKGILQKENNLEVNPEIPVFSTVTRLSEQKGLDLIIDILPKMMKMNAQFIILGMGEKRYQDKLEKLHKKYRDKFGLNIRFDTAMAKRIYAGSDVFVMPSQYEPCGLGQIIALRYGTVPLVRETGGLADTIQDYDSKTGEGNGILFSKYTGNDFLDAIKRTAKLYKEKDHWRKMIQNGMQADFSWESSAKKYVDLYRRVERKAFV